MKKFVYVALLAVITLVVGCKQEGTTTETGTTGSTATTNAPATK